MMLIHKICMAFRGLGSFRNVDIVINEIAAMLLHMENRKKKNSQEESKYVCLYGKRPKRFSDWTCLRHKNLVIMKSSVEKSM